MRKEPGNVTIYVTVDRKIVGKLFMVGTQEIVDSFIADVNDSSPHYVLYIDTLSGERNGG